MDDATKTGPPILIKFKDAEHLTTVSRASLYRQIKAGELSLVKVGRSSRLVLAEVEAWAARLPRRKGGADA